MGEMTFQQALDEFKTVYMPARNLAPRTRIEYVNDLKAFIDFLIGHGITRVGEINTILVDRYLARLDEIGFSGSTRKRKAITYRSFLSFLFRSGYINQDISKKVILPFPDHPIPRILTKSEYQRLLQVCSDDVRDKAIITLLLQTGIRLSELTSLTMANVHLPDDIAIFSKGSRKGRTIPLNSKTSEVLQTYITYRPSAINQFLFLNNLGKPIGNRGVEKIINQYYHRANIIGASVQTLRHTFAVQHIIKGTSLKTIQVIMGHQDIRTTEEYGPLAKELAQKELEENSL